MKTDVTIKSGKADILIKWVLFTAAITGLGLLSGFYPVEGNIPCIVIPCILVLILAKPVFFERLKLTTLLTMRILAVFAALQFFNPQVYVDIIMLMLIVNILEATFTDLLRHKRYFNAITGFVLAFSVVTLRGVWQFGAPFGKYYLAEGVVPAVTVCFVVAYTLWNWIFVTNEFSDSVALMHVGFLLAPILGSLCTAEMGVYGGLGMWLLLRANSLAIGGWMQIGAKDWFEREYHSERFAKFVLWTKKQNVQIVLMLINLALLGCAIYLTFTNGGVHFEFSPLFLN